MSACVMGAGQHLACRQLAAYGALLPLLPKE
jgi:hypothetical protein